MIDSPCVMEKPLLSVIVPVYNTAPWLGRCLDSICAQTYRNLEILCVNDGSTDNSAEILAEYAARDSRIKVITQENAGLSAARNTALEHATGEWVTGVDSDDYLAPDVYERAVERIAPAVDMVFFGVRDVDEEGEELPPNPYFVLPAAGVYEMTPELGGQLNACFWSKLWRRSLLEENNLRFPHGLVHEDEALYFLSAPYTRKVAICPEIGYYYVQRQGSIMNSEKMGKVQRMLRYVPIMEFVREKYEQRGWFREPKREYFASMMLRLCAAVFWERNEPDGEALANLYGKWVEELKLHKFDYRLERLIPVRRWRRWFMIRYDSSRVYYFFGIPLFAVIYDENGRYNGRRLLLWEGICKWCKRCFSRA